MSEPPAISRLTRGLRHGLGTDTGQRAIVPPWYPSTNYSFDDLGQPGGDYDYGRTNNPTRSLVAEALATLEGGAGCVFTSSGMSAASLAVLALVPTGGRVVATHDLYGGTWRLLERFSDQSRLTVDFVDLTDLDLAGAALQRPVDLLWVETPSNPLLRISDVRALADLGHAAGATVLVDNTFCSPLLQQPLDLGADLVMHSATKFINGHSDVIAGALVSRDQALHDDLSAWANTLGVTGSSFDAWLTLRGLRTLEVRQRVHEQNALAVVDLLRQHPAVNAVHHPSQVEHPGHEVAVRQQSGFGSLVSLDLHAGRDAASTVVRNLHCFDLAESLGGVESLVAHPSSMTHAAMPPEVQAAAGITPGLLRLSVGIEPVADLLADLRHALDQI
ncbi:trans-sulfuration enzyme family protein [Aestuariimicrobium sp. T2.26MG-19.2B]|uniref:trans-sulfuration enzyme family protein n=1 Tax=Aestuariimicrobium sp. T2.26MG-19.2B TaxID=3040679 RepID=UPI0024773953|nr:PLP-dependent aspartate aminotransferase family protein [Aestuariimicrobium sp. T2.26MG-19.2B]CAI9401198.1 Cystathionine gamma-synthase [Aestuariimicrobium sp. T2.26MG-19.2B]